MRLGGSIGPVFLGLQLFSVAALAEDAPKRAEPAKRAEPTQSARPTDARRTEAKQGADKKQPRDERDAKQEAPPTLTPAIAPAASLPQASSPRLQLVIPDYQYWQPSPSKVVLWLRGPYDAVVQHEDEPLVLSGDGDTEYRHTLDLSDTPAGVRLQGYMAEQRAEQACVAGRDCRGRDMSQGVRVVTKRGRFVGAETTRELQGQGQGSSAAPVQGMRVVTGRQW